MKLFMMVMVVLFIYLPIQCYFFYTNWPNPFYSYTFSRTHQPTWGAVLYLHIYTFPQFQYWNWSPISLAILLFFWYGVTNEAINGYRVGLLRVGFGRCWPILKEPYVSKKRNAGTRPSKASWLQNLDLVSRAVNYMDGKNKDGTEKITTVKSQVNQSTQSR